MQLCLSTVQVVLREESPLPPVVHQWYAYSVIDAKEWEARIRSRCDAYIGPGASVPSWEQTVDLDSIEFTCTDDECGSQ